MYLRLPSMRQQQYNVTLLLLTNYVFSLDKTYDNSIEGNINEISLWQIPVSFDNKKETVACDTDIDH